MTRSKGRIFLTFLFAVNLVKTFKNFFSLCFSQCILTKSIRKGKRNTQEGKHMENVGQ